MSKVKKQVEGMVARTLLLSAKLDYRITLIAQDRNIPKVLFMRRALEAACDEAERGTSKGVRAS